MMPHRVLCCLCVLLGACEAGETPRAAGEAPRAAADIAAVDCVQFTEHGLLLDGLTRAELLEALGPPDSVEWSVVRLHDGNADSLFVVRYAGLDVSLHRPAGGTEIADQVRVRDNRYLRFPLLGTAADRVTAAITGGSPFTAEDQLIYNCHSHPANDNPVAFRVANGAVTEIVYTYYMD